MAYLASRLEEDVTQIDKYLISMGVPTLCSWTSGDQLNEYSLLGLEHYIHAS